MPRMIKCGLRLDYLDYAIVVATVSALAWLISRWNWVDDYKSRS